MPSLRIVRHNKKNFLLFCCSYEIINSRKRSYLIYECNEFYFIASFGVSYFPFAIFMGFTSSITLFFFLLSTPMHYPKQTKFRKYQKGFASGCKPEGSKLSFGKFGIKSLEATRISSQVIEATRRTISRKLKRSGQIWVRVFADIPVSQKPAEVRMGKGKGQPSFWIARVQTGQLLFEMDGVSLQNAQQAAILASHKLGFRTKFVQWIEPLQIKKQ